MTEKLSEITKKYLEDKDLSSYFNSLLERIDRFRNSLLQISELHKENKYISNNLVNNCHEGRSELMTIYIPDHEIRQYNDTVGEKFNENLTNKLNEKQKILKGVKKLKEHIESRQSRIPVKKEVKKGRPRKIIDDDDLIEV